MRPGMQRQNLLTGVHLSGCGQGGIPTSAHYAAKPTEIHFNWESSERGQMQAVGRRQFSAPGSGAACEQRAVHKVGSRQASQAG